MRQIVYTLRFVGYVTPLDTAKDLCRVTTTAPSCALTTLIGPEGVRGIVELIPSYVARCTATLRRSGDGAFIEAGTISFGDGGHSLHFVTRGEGMLLPSPQPERSLGSVTWQVRGGEGRFDGAHGLITSNFLMDADGAIEEIQVGTIFLQ
jgi:hypothetical protein